MTLFVTLLEERFAYHLAQSVLSACRMHQAAIQGDGYLVGGKRKVLIINLTVSVEIGTALKHVEGDTIGSRVHNRGIQRTLAIWRGVCLQRVLFPLRTVHVDSISLHAIKGGNPSQRICHQHGILGRPNGVVHISIH